MKTLRLVVKIVAIVILLVGGAYQYMQRVPSPQAKLPNPKYGFPAIKPEVIANTQDFTVLISDESMGNIERGTGILLDSRHVVTCAHVIPKQGGQNDMWIYPYPGAQVVHCKVTFVSFPNDLALLELNTPVLGHKHASFQTNVGLGEPVVVVGNVEGFMLWYVSYGIISGEYGMWLLTDASIRGGNSGGPWVNSKGEVVGMTDVSWFNAKGANLGVSGAIPAKRIKKFLEESHNPDIMYALTGE